MKLKNKKTGEIIELERLIEFDTEDRTYEFPSIESLCKEWEDYKENLTEVKMSKYKPSQKLWRIIKEPGGYYYEMRLPGVTFDRIRVEEPALKFLKEEGII